MQSLSEQRDPDPCVKTPARRLGASRGEARMINARERLIQRACDVDIREPHIQRAVPRHVSLLYQVAPPEIQWFLAQPTCGNVDQSFAGVHVLGPARATIGAGGGRAGGDTFNRHMRRRNTVHTGQMRKPVLYRHHRARCQIRAQIDAPSGANRAQNAGRVERGFHFKMICPSMAVGCHRLVATRHPFYWTSQATGSFQAEHIFRVKPVLLPESTTGVGCNHPHPVSRHAKDPVRQRPLHQVNPLRAHIQRETPCGRVMDPDRPARFKRHSVHAINRDRSTDDVCGLPKGSLTGSGIPAIEGENRLSVRMVERQARWQDFETDLYGFGGLEGGLTRIGHDKGHRIAHMANGFIGQHRLLARSEIPERLAWRRNIKWDAPDPGLGKIGRNQDQMHPSDGPCCRGVDTLDARLGVRRSHHCGVGYGVNDDIVKILRRTSEKPRIF